MINNNMSEQISYLIVLIHMLKDGLHGLIGGVVAYLFELKKADKEGVKKQFMFSGMLLSASLGMFVGYVVGTFTPLDTFARDGIIALSGLSSYSILVLADSRFARYVIDKISAK